MISESIVIDSFVLSQSIPDWWSEVPNLAPQPVQPKPVKPFAGVINFNPSPEEFAALQKRRIECLEQAKRAQIQKAHNDVDTMRSQNAAVKSSRLQDGLSHLDNLVIDQEKPRGKLSHKPTAEALNHVLFKVGIQDTVVKSSAINGVVRPRLGGGIRGKVTKLSRASVQRMKLHFRNSDPASCKAMLTLTYPNEFSSDGKEVKRHLDLMKRWLKRHGVSDGSWFLEFQPRRGAPHFHAYLSAYPAGGVNALANAWYNIVGSGDEKHLAFHRGELSGRPCLEYMRVPHAASAYATKYATKQEQKEVPAEYQDVGRFWGCWGKSRPVWRYLYGRGWDSLQNAHKAVVSFRSRFQGGEELDKWSRRAYASSVMWGGSDDLHELLDSAGWFPF